MKWFRSNIKRGSRLALFALAVQFAAAFGHFHATVAQAAPALQSAAMQSESSTTDRLGAASALHQQQPASDSDSDQQPNDACAICAVISLASTVLFATPPLLLLLPQAIELLYLTATAEFVHLNSARVAFQPRAPPIS